MENDKIVENKVQQDGSVPVQVLEYYTKYSLNPELPKYFSGEPVQVSDWHATHSDEYIPQMEDCKDKTTSCIYKRKAKPPLTGLDKICEVSMSANDDNVVASSPASSVASNRKLEWDNGADIGYNNVHRTLQKSISLPILNKFEYEELQNKLLLPAHGPSRLLTKNVQLVPEHSGSDNSNSDATPDVLPLSSSSTSSSAKLHNKQSLPLSSTSSPLQPQLSSDSDSFHFKCIQEVSSSFHNKIGFPAAESTPVNSKKAPGLKEFMNNGTGKASFGGLGLSSVKGTNNVDINMVDKISTYKHFKLLKLAISKPVIVECVVNLNIPKNAEHKLIQTSLVKNVSIGLQTDAVFVQKSPKNKHVEQQSIFFMYHSDSDAERNTNNSSVQTNESEMLSNHCQSFEYLQGDELNNKGVNNLWINLQADLTSLTSGSSQQNSDNTSTHSPLAQLLAAHQSDQRIPDFQKNVRLLQKLLNSCKYNNTTKKFYLKMVLKKMFDTKYADDSTSEPSPVSENIGKTDLHQNAGRKQNRQQKFQVQTFSNEILPQDSVRTHFIPIENAKLSRNPMLTLTNKGALLNNISKDNNTPAQSLSKTETPLVTSNNLRSVSSQSSGTTWRENKTRSEQIIEENGSGDCITPKIQNDLKGDLEWINKEILNLNKLKRKLKQKKSENNVLQAVLHKPHIEDMNALKDPTAVYVLTTETVDFVCHNCRPQTCNNPKCRYQYANSAQGQSNTGVPANYPCDNKITSHTNGPCGYRVCPYPEMFSTSSATSRLSPRMSEYRRNSPPLHNIQQRVSKDSGLRESEHVSVAPQGRNPPFHKRIPETNDDLETHRTSTISPTQSENNQASSTKQSILRSLSPSIQQTYFVNRILKNNEEVIPKKPSAQSDRQAPLSPSRSRQEPYLYNKIPDQREVRIPPRSERISQLSPRGSRQSYSSSEREIPLFENQTVEINESPESHTELTTPQTGLYKPADVEINSIGSLTIEIPIETPTENISRKLLADKFINCVCPCRAHKSKPTNLVQQLVCVGSIEEDNTNIISSKPSNKTQTQCWLEISEEDKTKKCTCCSVCLMNADKQGIIIDRVTGIKSKQGSVESIRNGVVIEGHIKRDASNQSNKACQIDTVTNQFDFQHTTTTGPFNKSNSPTVVPQTTENQFAFEHTSQTNKSQDKQVSGTKQEFTFECNSNSGVIEGSFKKGSVAIPYKKTGSTRAEPSHTESELNEVEIHVPRRSDFKSNKITQTSNSINKNHLRHSSSGSSSTSSYSSLTELCIPVMKYSCDCCKRKVDIPSTAKGVPQYILCHPCYRQNQEIPYYTNPDHVCKCHPQTNQILQEIRETVNELNSLEKASDYCKCYNSKMQHDSGYCLYCKGKFKHKHATKKGIAYTLTLEPDDKRHKKSKKREKSSLEEIKIKVPTHGSNQKHYRHRLELSSDESSSKENSTKKHKQRTNNHKKKSSQKHTLQDYLFVNKPDFIESAEHRRRCLVELAYIREQRCLKYKQLLALLADVPLKNNIPFQNLMSNNQKFGPKHLFTAAQMKEITAKHYKKLPEVQQKLVDLRDLQVKKANKLLTDIFNQRLRQQVLRGKHTIPTTASII